MGLHAADTQGGNVAHDGRLTAVLYWKLDGKPLDSISNSSITILLLLTIIGWSFECRLESNWNLGSEH